LYKQYWVNAILCVGLIVFCILWVTSEDRKSTYEDYLSSVIADKVAIVSNYPSYSSSIVVKILADEEVTKSQATELVETFWELYREIQDLEGFAIRLGEIEKDEVTNNYQAVIYEYYSYMVNLQSMDADSIAITNKQKDDLEKMHEQLNTYSKVVKEQIKFTSDEKDPSPLFYQYYRELGINDDYWIKLLTNLEQVSDVNNILD
jgi:hypothetical protein